jgi:FAD/FMN-containing dehydrogenase
MLSEKKLQDLADITGEDFFSAEEYMRKLYSHDIASLPGLVKDILNTEADAVAQPVNAEVVSNLLKYCLQNKIPVVPRGHGTSGYGGALPTNGGLVIETTRMNEIHNIDRDNMTIEVGAGIIWGRLLELLEDEGLTVGAYPSSAPSSTVGGWIAAGGSGIGSTKYGGIREQVVDMEVVLPDGRIIRTDSPPKELLSHSNDGYAFYPEREEYLWGIDKVEDVEDLKSLMVDSNGGLGIITKAVLKVIPLRKIQPIVASFEDRDKMIRAMEHIMATTRPYYLHFITSSFHKMLDEVGQPAGTTHDWLFLCTLEGTDEDLAKEQQKVTWIVNTYGGVLESEEVAHHEWGERFYPMRIKRLGPSLAPSEVYVPLSTLGDFLTHMDKHFKREQWSAEGAVNEKGEVAVLTWFLDDERKRISFLMGWYRSLDVINIGLKHEGSAYSIGMWNTAHSRSFFGKDNYAKMAKLKKQADAKNNMNPHKVFSGPLRLSFRMNLLIMIAVTIAAPIVLWVAGFFVADIIMAYVPWLMITSIESVFIAAVIGLIAGVAVVEIANMVPVSFVLTIGGPFLRLGRRIFH